MTAVLGGSIHGERFGARMLLRRFHPAAGAWAAVGDDEVGDEEEVDEVREDVDMSRGTPRCSRSTRLALLEEKVEERDRGEIRASWWARTSSRRTSKDDMRRGLSMSSTNFEGIVVLVSVSSIGFIVMGMW